jgi:hypothetical protein
MEGVIVAAAAGSIALPVGKEAGFFRRCGGRRHPIPASRHLLSSAASHDLLLHVLVGSRAHCRRQLPRSSHRLAALDRALSTVPLPTEHNKLASARWTPPPPRRASRRGAAPAKGSTSCPRQSGLKGEIFRGMVAGVQLSQVYKEH